MLVNEKVFQGINACKLDPCLDLAMSADDRTVISSPILAAQHTHCQANLNKVNLKLARTSSEETIVGYELQFEKVWPGTLQFREIRSQET